jgi:hypothetical protein
MVGSPYAWGQGVDAGGMVCTVCTCPSVGRNDVAQSEHMTWGSRSDGKPITV